jgi:hypothetical protein
MIFAEISPLNFATSISDKKNYKFIDNSLQIFLGAKRKMLGNISLLRHTAWSHLITA